LHLLGGGVFAASHGGHATQRLKPSTYRNNMKLADRFAKFLISKRTKRLAIHDQILR
jgi:hypothetical protein